VMLSDSLMDRFSVFKNTNANFPFNEMLNFFMLLLVVRCQEIASREFIFKIFLGSFAPSALAIPGYALIVRPPFQQHWIRAWILPSILRCFKIGFFKSLNYQLLAHVWALTMPCCPSSVVVRRRRPLAG
jgi:hypothetical protein